MKARAWIAAGAMLGRALEGICRDKLPNAVSNGKHLLLWEGVERLRSEGVIDEPLHRWAKHLHAIRNETAHPGEAKVCAADAHDMLRFLEALIIQVYELPARFEEFEKRVAAGKGPHERF